MLSTFKREKFPTTLNFCNFFFAISKKISKHFCMLCFIYFFLPLIKKTLMTNIYGETAAVNR